MKILTCSKNKIINSWNRSNILLIEQSKCVLTINSFLTQHPEVNTITIGHNGHSGWLDSVYRYHTWMWELLIISKEFHLNHYFEGKIRIDRGRQPGDTCIRFVSHHKKCIHDTIPWDTPVDRSYHRNLLKKILFTNDKRKYISHGDQI